MVPRASRHLVITGLMGAGKSTVGPLVATMLGRPWTDSDATIEARVGRTGRIISVEEGITALHDLESEHLLGALEAETAAVIGAAPSVLDRPDCVMELERAAVTVWLDVEPGVLAARQSSSAHRRQLAQPQTELSEMRRRRLGVLSSIGGLAVSCGKQTPQEVATAVVEMAGRDAAAC